LSSSWLRAVPRALVARRLWVPVFVAFGGLAPASGCGVVTSSPSVASAPAIDASVGVAFGGGETDAAGSCLPSNVATFVQGPYQPAAAPSGACLGADGGGVWGDFYDACLGPEKSSDKCADFKATPSNAACAACVLTPYTADQLGPILSFGEFVGGNVAGCIEISAPSDVSCAKAVQALTDCENAACQANCPVTDPTSLVDRQNCASQADLLGCQLLSGTASGCRAAEADAGLAQPCANTGFSDFYDVVFPLFGGQSATGADAGAGADAAVGLSTDGGPDAAASDAGTD
jgi:hypothetical protein